MVLPLGTFMRTLGGGDAMPALDLASAVLLPWNVKLQHFLLSAAHVQYTDTYGSKMSLNSYKHFDQRKVNYDNPSLVHFLIEYSIFFIQSVLLSWIC